MTRNEFIDRLNVYARTFIPDVRPACANFVTRAIHDIITKDFPVMNYVPDVVNYFNNVLKLKSFKYTKGNPGDVVVFDRTYDAVLPAGIGAEDTMTHIGFIIMDDGSLYLDILDFSASADKPIFRNYKNMHEDIGWRINRIYDMSLLFTKEFSAKDAYKIFFHNGKMSLVCPDGKTHPITSFEGKMEVNVNG